MSPERGLSATGLIEEGRLDAESEERRAANPGVFDPAFRVPVIVRFEKEEYLFDFSLSFDEVQTACQVDLSKVGRWGSGLSLGCTIPDFVDVNRLAVEVKTEPERLGVGIVHSPVHITVTLAPLAYRLFVPTSEIAFQGMSGRVTKDTLNHELHHLIVDRELTQSFKARLARAVRARVMALRRLAASDRSMRGGALSKGAIVAVVSDTYPGYMEDFRREGNRHSDLAHSLGEDYPLLTESEIRVMWPAFRMPARRPGTKGTFEP
jgi:hypothetical protein